MIHRFSLILFAFAGAWAAGETLWEPGRVVSVEQVSTPAKTPDPSCRSLPRGSNPPPQCRPANLRAENFWRVTVEAGNKRFVVRPYRDSGLLGALSPDIVYVDPNLKAAAAVEVSVVSSKAIRLRVDQGAGIPALVESQELTSKVEAPAAKSSTTPPVVVRLVAPAPVTATSKVILLESGDFVDLEIRDAQAQDIGGGAVLYSFDGDTSQKRAGSSSPVFLVLAENELAGNEAATTELARLQVSKGARQLVYSIANHRSASAVPIEVTQVSATVRKISVKQALPPGEYVVLIGNSTRGFLFDVR